MELLHAQAMIVALKARKLPSESQVKALCEKAIEILGTSAQLTRGFYQPGAVEATGGRASGHGTAACTDQKIVHENC